MHSTPDRIMLYGKLGVDFFYTSEFLKPKTKTTLQLIGVELNCYMISDNPNVSFGIVDCSLYIRGIPLKDHYQKKRMVMLAFIAVKYNYLEVLANSSIIPARQKQFIQGNNFSTNLISDKKEYSEMVSQM